MTRPFRPGDLDGLDGFEPTTAELADAAAAARDLETTLSASDVHPSAGFADRVMSAVAAEPRPQPAIAAGAAVRGGRVRELLGSLSDMWRVATTGGRPFAVRAQAAAFVLVAALAVVSLGGVAAVGALQVIAPAHTGPVNTLPTEPQATATPTPEPTAEPSPSETPEPTDTTEPSETPEPTDTAEPADQSSSGSGRRPTPRPSDGHSDTEPPDSTNPPDGGGGNGGGGGGGHDGSSHP